MSYLYDADSLIDYLTGYPGARAQFRAFLRDGIAMSIVTLSRPIALRTARLRQELLGRRLPIKQRAYDLIVAATALQHGLTLVSSNVRDYQDIPDLVLFDPRTILSPSAFSGLPSHRAESARHRPRAR